MLTYIISAAILLFIATIIGQQKRILFLKNKIKDLSQLTVKDYWLIRERIKYMSYTDFEDFICSLWNHFDGCIAYTTQETRDGGKDILLRDHGKLTFIECKHWLPNDEHRESVGRPIAMKLRGAMDYGNGSEPAIKGMIFTTSDFTQDCIQYCNAMDIEMWDLNDIMRMVEKIGTEDVYEDAGINYDGRYIFED